MTPICWSCLVTGQCHPTAISRIPDVACCLANLGKSSLLLARDQRHRVKSAKSVPSLSSLDTPAAFSLVDFHRTELVVSHTS